jgi:hypothetical protein
VKIDANDHAPAISALLQARSFREDLQRSFSDLLTGVASDRRSGSHATRGSVAAPQSEHEDQQYALGFGELGVFGRYGALAAPESPSARSEINQKKLAGGARANSRDLQNILSESITNPTGLLFDCAAAGPTDRADASVRKSLPSNQHRESAPPAEVASTGAFLSTAENVEVQFAVVPAEESNGATRARAFASTIRSAFKSPVSVSVYEESGTLSIVARSADNQEDYLALRRMVEETAAEFGLRVDEFQLNGSKQKSFTSVLGGNSGNRTR